ncbi:MAG TPA: rhodanese-like domain-containing protein [Thermoanaerobaculia bacterium]|nr:rhodanese-like domain-containing protein [Thermoanaerobaculia bacterium]
MGIAGHSAERRRRFPWRGRLPPTRPLLAKLAALAALAALAGAAAACRSGRGEPPPFRKVRPAVAYEILRDSPETLVLDLRTAEEFAGPEGHLERALNLPEARLAWRLIEISSYRDQTLLVYCRDADCGEEAMGVLVTSGFRDAFLIQGGFAAWVADGFDTVLAGENAPPPVLPED